MAAPLRGTGTVTSTTDVAWTGAVLSAANCKQGFPVVINKQATFVDELVDTTHFTVDPPVDNGTGLQIAISPLSPNNVTIASLNVSAAALMEQLSVVDANGRGLFLNNLGVTGANDPGPGFLARDNSSWPSVTALYFDALDANGQPAIERMMLWGIDTVLTVRSIETNAFAAFRMTEVPVNEDTDEWVSCSNLVYLEGDGILVDGEALSVEWNRRGAAGPGLDYDAAVPDLAGRAAYNAQVSGYRVLVADTGAPFNRTAIYVKNSGTSGDWSDPFWVSGSPGRTGMVGAVSDEYTPIVVGTQKFTGRQIGNFTLTEVRINCRDASSSGKVDVDVKVNGSSVFSTRVTIDAGEKTSTSAAIPAVIANALIPDDAEVTIDIVGSGTGVTGLKFALIGDPS